MEPHSLTTVRSYLQAVDACLRSNSARLSASQATVVRWSAVYACSFWAERHADPTARQLVRAFVGPDHLAEATLLLETAGTDDGRLAPVNAGLYWCHRVDADRPESPLDVRGHTVTCCLCRRPDQPPHCFSPGLLLRQGVRVPVCLHCSVSVEQRVPLHRSAGQRWCAACGRSVLMRPTRDRGDELLCLECDALVVL